VPLEIARPNSRQSTDEEAALAVDPRQEALDPARWVDEHGDALFRFAILRVRDEELAADLVQDTFLSALKAKDGFRGGSSLRTWLIGILKHKIVDHFRKNRVDVVSSDASPGSESAEHAHSGVLSPSWNESPSKLVENREFWAVLRGCLGDLPEAQRRAFSMREFDGLPGDEISKVLDVTPTNLWVMLHRARGRLRDCLERKWFGTR
jgi:RNA polymerase sigma-70 factor (ECF subfamily)